MRARAAIVSPLLGSAVTTAPLSGGWSGGYSLRHGLFARRHIWGRSPIVGYSAVKNPVTPAHTQALQARQDRVKDIIKVMKDRNIWDFLQDAFQEQDPTVLAGMSAIMWKIHTYQFKDDFAADWLALFQFIQNKQQVEACFDELENALQHYAEQLPIYLPMRDDGKYVLPSSEKEPYQTYDILTGYLMQWARQNGFAHTAKLTRKIDPFRFFQVLSTKTYFEDISLDVSDEHGAMSHALQWFAIIMHQQKTGFLLSSPAELYQQFGHLSQESEFFKPLWIDILDIYNGDSYSSPEFITRTLMDEASSKRWPLLAESVQRIENELRNWRKDVDGYEAYLRNKYGMGSARGIVRSDNEVAGSKLKN